MAKDKKGGGKMEYKHGGKIDLDKASKEYLARGKGSGKKNNKDRNTPSDG